MMIKLLRVSLLFFLHRAHSSIEIAQFGGCLNETKLAEGPEHGEEPAFHCHYDSSSCALEDEIWLDPVEVVNQGHGPCTCDENFADNVYGFGCYDMYATHAVECTATSDQCPEGWYHLGHRFNNHLVVDDQCTDGDSAFGGGYDTSYDTMCGKRCTCHFEYRFREDVLESYSVQHGLCHNPTTSESYCAVSAASCDTDETFYGSLSPQVESFDCTCEKTETGACLDGDNAFAYCAVAADSCRPTQTFISRNELHSSSLGVDCRLCAGISSPSPLPSFAPFTPSASPTAYCVDDASFRFKTKAGKSKSCKWLHKMESRQNKYCSIKDEETKTRIKFMCRDACRDYLKQCSNSPPKCPSQCVPKW